MHEGRGVVAAGYWNAPMNFLGPPGMVFLVFLEKEEKKRRFGVVGQYIMFYQPARWCFKLAQVLNEALQVSHYNEVTLTVNIFE